MARAHDVSRLASPRIVALAGDAGHPPAGASASRGSTVVPLRGPRSASSAGRAWEVLTGTDTAAEGVVDLDDAPNGRTSFHAQGWTRVRARDGSFTDGTLSLPAVLVSGPGFAVFLRAELDARGRACAGWTVQVDVGWDGGALLVRRWRDDWESHPIAVAAAPAARLVGAHTLTVTLDGPELVATWSDVRLAADLGTAARELGGRWAGRDGDQVAVRTWGTTRLDAGPLVLSRPSPALRHVGLDRTHGRAG